MCENISPYSLGFETYSDSVLLKLENGAEVMFRYSSQCIAQFLDCFQGFIFYIDEL